MELPIGADHYQLKPGTELALELHDSADFTAFPGTKGEGEALFKPLNDELQRLQELLYAEGKNKMLIVLQGLDTSGKDSVIRHVFDGVNPQGVHVKSFKVPTKEELAHHFLWRVWPHVPGKGMISIFNRSQYEDILVPVVRGYIREHEAAAKVEAINGFEKALAEDGTTILKFLLNISKEEQLERFRARLEHPRKQWKFNPGDLEARSRWDLYMSAYEMAISQTSTEYAPWYIIPADRKWYRNLVIACVIVSALLKLDMSYPKLDYDPAAIDLDSLA